MGSTRVARNAGKYVASSATAVSSSDTPAKVASLHSLITEKRSHHSASQRQQNTVGQAARHTRAWDGAAAAGIVAAAFGRRKPATPSFPPQTISWCTSSKELVS